MANEILINNYLECTNGSFKYVSKPGAKYITQTTAGGYFEIISCTTSDTALTLGAMSSANYGYARFTNLDATNYVDFGPTVAGAIAPFVRVKAGEQSGWFRLTPSITLRSQANTATVKVFIEVLQT